MFSNIFCVQVTMIQFILIILSMQIIAFAQEYKVGDIRCDFPASYGLSLERKERLLAKIRKPNGFHGHPIFADDRSINPAVDPVCQIRRSSQDPTGHEYLLQILDFSSCGTTKKDGYITVRLWFPQLNGVVLATDQEVIIMCKPTLPTIIENRAAGFSGALPTTGRVTGVVEESPGRLEYEVSLLKESQDSIKNNHLVEDAVPIGSRLLLKARINTRAGAWKHIKLMDVVVSSDSLNAYTQEHVILVKNGCRDPAFKSIVPYQPKKSDNEGEVIMEFQAFMLDSKVNEASQLWIHAKIKACIDYDDCRPESCLDSNNPIGFGRRRRDLIPDQAKKILNNSVVSTSSTEVGDNIPLTVMFPEEFFEHVEQMETSCNAYMVTSFLFGFSLLLSIGLLCLLSIRLRIVINKFSERTLDSVIKQHQAKFGYDYFSELPFK